MGENGKRVSPRNSRRKALSPPGFLAFVVAVIIFYLGKSVFIRQPSCLLAESLRCLSVPQVSEGVELRRPGVQYIGKER